MGLLVLDVEGSSSSSTPPRNPSRRRLVSVFLLVGALLEEVSGFAPVHLANTKGLAVKAAQRSRRIRSLRYSVDDREDDDEDDDDYIDTESLGDWRNFRRSLTQLSTDQEEATEGESEGPRTKRSTTVSVSKENEDLLLSQNEELHKEYKTGVWAHQVATVRRAIVFFGGGWLDQVP